MVFANIHRIYSFVRNAAMFSSRSHRLLYALITTATLCTPGASLLHPAAHVLMLMPRPPCKGPHGRACDGTQRWIHLRGA